MKIATWFINKNYSQNERYAMSITEPIIKKETEKAYFLVFNTEYGTIKGWFPKSVCENESEENEKFEKYECGQKVISKSFGLGKVVNDLGAFVIVEFDKYTKTLAKQYAKLELA